MVSIALARFHKVNTSFGEAIADQVLRQTAERLQSIPMHPIPCRILGTHFAMVLAEIHDEHEVASFVQRVVRAFAEPIQVDKLGAGVEVASGIALYPNDGDDIDTLLRYASAARVQVVQEASGAGYQFHTADLHQRTWNGSAGKRRCTRHWNTMNSCCTFSHGSICPASA